MASTQQNYTSTQFQLHFCVCFNCLVVCSVTLGGIERPAAAPVIACGSVVPRETESNACNITFDSLKRLSPIAKAIAPQQAIHPKKTVQIGNHLNLPPDTIKPIRPIRDETPSRTLPCTTLRVPCAFFRTQSEFFARPCSSVLVWLTKVWGFPRNAYEITSRFVPQTRQNLAASRFCVAHSGQYIKTHLSLRVVRPRQVRMFHHCNKPCSDLRALSLRRIPSRAVARRASKLDEARIA